MAYRTEKTEQGVDLVIDGWEKGIAPSPHKGIANMQAVNISTEPNEVMVSYSRTQQSQTVTNSTGTISPSGTTNFTVSFGGLTLQPGQWIQLSGSTITGVADGNYYILQKSGNLYQLATTYLGSAVTGHGTTGSATFNLERTMSTPIASATETYSTNKYRYFILDDQGLVWVQDTGVTTAGITWILPDVSLLSGASGIAVLNGWVLVFAGTTIWCKSTVNLGDATGSSFPGPTGSLGWLTLNGGNMNSSSKHFAMTGHNSNCYYTDGNFVGSITPTSVQATGGPNIFSFASYTASTTTGTATILEGTTPYNGISNSYRVPAFFFATSGAKPTAITVGTIYYIKWLNSTTTFEVYAAASGGSALDLQTGATGTQYFNTFYPVSSGGAVSFVFSPQALTLAANETAQSMTEIGAQVAIGCVSNTVYQWDQNSAFASGFVALPERNVVNLITVNNMAYAFAGSRGNIYVTNGSTASLVLTVPDYCAGIAGTESSYVEPYFTWGGAMFLRGRVYFSIQDQTASKTGNCGGIWSFTPTQNFFIGQDTGLALRMENQNSYGTYNGAASVLLPSQNQSANSPQYWSGWYSSVSNATYGIDFVATDFLVTNAVIETDLIPTGTLLDKKTFEQIEYKLAAPLVFPESVSIGYRNDSTSAFTSVGTAIVENTTTNGTISGYFLVNFQKTQWLQLQITLVASNSAPSSSSFNRLLEVRVR